MFVVFVCVPGIPRLTLEICKSATQPAFYKSVFMTLTSTSFAPLRSLASREPVASRGCVAILAPIISDPAR